MWVRSCFVGMFFWAQVAVAADAPPQQQLNQTLETLAKTKENDAALQKRLASVRQEYETLQNHSTELAERLQISERRVGSEEKALADVSGRLATKQKEFDERKADYARTVTTLLRMRELPMTALFAEPDHGQQLIEAAGVLEKTNVAVAKKARALAQDLQELKALKNDTALRRKRTEAETAALDTEQQQLAKALQARQKLQAQLSADHAHEQEKVAALSHESESLQALISKLDAAARAQAKVEKTVPVAPPSRKFTGAKGSLHAPVSGEVLHRYGDRKSAGETYRGMVFRARPGATVVAPYDGEVVFTGPFRDYGNMLLIKHQNGYISLISGVGKLTASLHQNVIRGEPVALMGSDKNAEAYVELRDSDAKPIDPGDWFANVGKVITQK